MYRLVILSIVAVSALADEMGMRECGRMFHPHTVRCCKKTSELKDKFMLSEDLKECFQMRGNPVTCENEVCIAKKKGFATDDDKLDYTKLEEVMTKEIDDKDLLADMIKNCVNGDLEKYGPPDFCEFMKMRHCISMQMLNHCPDWDDAGECSKLKGAVADCVKLFA
ncbi:hypothetical protein PYW07_002093 [Mythimna separata]|uniref:Uncharacterized protein n=1 Tax=Mythimna separata TaxID=271217 RepID=A0AAD7YMU0_MYTSE|nr:hypothetical protein PYW07_002093 [Mythimna separata]